MNNRLDRRAAVAGCETRSYALEIRATGDDGTLEGYGSVFGVRDLYSDVIDPGAFKATLAAHKAAKTMPAMLWQHDADEPIGVWSEMEEDGKGLRVKGRLSLETTRGREAHALLKMGALNGLSIGFVATEKSYSDRDQTRTIKALDLWEVSLVTFPANGKARITAVKAADVAQIKTIRQAETALRDAGLSDDAAKALIATVKRIALDERDARGAVAQAQSVADRLLRNLQS